MLHWMELQEQDMRQLNGWRERKRERYILKRALNKGKYARESDVSNRLRKYNKKRNQEMI